MDVTKYDFAEYVTFVVDLEPENIQSYVSEGMQVNFMSEKKTTLADIVCPQSIFIFHSLNAIIVVFKERVVPSITVPKSIMKKNSNITKKMVRFHNSKTKRTIWKQNKIEIWHIHIKHNHVWHLHWNTNL